MDRRRPRSHHHGVALRQHVPDWRGCAAGGWLHYLSHPIAPNIAQSPDVQGQLSLHRSTSEPSKSSFLMQVLVFQFFIHALHLRMPTMPWIPLSSSTPAAPPHTCSLRLRLPLQHRALS